MMLRLLSLGCGLLCLISLVGCGGADDGHVTAGGTVTYNGNPLEKGEIAFVNAEGMTAAVSPVVNGAFDLKATASRPGIDPGQYAVTVSAWKREPGSVDEQGNIIAEGEPAIPAKYMNYKTSELSATIGNSGASSLTFELSGEPGQK
jgi:hypothetical protein